MVRGGGGGGRGTSLGEWEHNNNSNFGDEQAFHRLGLCVSGWTHVTNGGSVGMMSTAGLELPYPRVSQASFSEGKVM